MLLIQDENKDTACLLSLHAWGKRHHHLCPLLQQRTIFKVDDLFHIVTPSLTLKSALVFSYFTSQTNPDSLIRSVQSYSSSEAGRLFFLEVEGKSEPMEGLKCQLPLSQPTSGLVLCSHKDREETEEVVQVVGAVVAH